MVFGTDDEAGEMSEQDEYRGFAPEHDAPIPYMKRIRDYYLALGYGEPYRWAHYAEVPFQPLERPLAECRVALITTAAPYQPGKGDQGPGAPYNAAAKFYAVYSGDSAVDHDLRTICGSPMSPSIGRTPPPRTATPGSRCRNCGAARRRAGSARSPRASTARRQTAATERRSRRTVRSCWRAAAPTQPKRPFSSPIDRCATRP